MFLLYQKKCMTFSLSFSLFKLSLLGISINFASFVAVVSGLTEKDQLIKKTPVVWFIYCGKKKKKKN